MYRSRICELSMYKVRTIHGLSVYRERTLDKITDIFG
jgi:hypothetical protein